jgi:hypothetical protein
VEGGGGGRGVGASGSGVGRQDSGLQAMEGDDISLAADLQAEGVGGPLQHKVWPVIGRRQGRADAITPHKHHPGVEKVGRDGGGAGS